MLEGQTYRPAEYTSPEDGTWRVFWYNVNPATGKLERIRKTFALNRIKDIKERHRIAAIIYAEINASLRQGYNEFEQRAQAGGNGHRAEAGEPGVIAVVEQSAEEIVSLQQAINEASEIKTKGKGKASANTYRSLTNQFTNWITAEKIGGKDVRSFRPRDFQRFINHRIDEGNGARNTNSLIVHVKALFDYMVHPLETLKANPIAAFKFLKEEDSDLYEPLTKEELERVANHLRGVHPDFLLFTQVIYYAYIRPTHIAGIQRSQINFERGTITIKGNNTKGNRNAVKQLLTPLRDALIARGIDKLPPNYFIFSDNFKPGPEKRNRLKNDGGDIWRDEVIGKLGIDKKMYALKHTSGTAYIEANENVDVAWLQAQMEHGSLAETENYVKKRKAKRIDESKTNLPGFGT